MKHWHLPVASTFQVVPTMVRHLVILPTHSKYASSRTLQSDHSGCEATLNGLAIVLHIRNELVRFNKNACTEDVTHYLTCSYCC